MKTYVLTFAKSFMKDHPRAGEPTDFKQKIIDTFNPYKPSNKIHTIRANYDYWAPKIDEVINDEARLSLRNWTGKPYRSKQHEFLSLSDAGYQSFEVDPNGVNIIDGKYYYNDKELANNDGLSEIDFWKWFEPKMPFKGILIHFTEFRY